MDPSVESSAAVKEEDATGAPIQSTIVSDEDIKMEEEPGHEAAMKPSEDTESGAPKPLAERHDSVFPEDIIEPKASPTSPLIGENLAHHTDSLISGAEAATAKPQAAEMPPTSTGKQVNLGSSIPRTSSLTASSKASPTLSSHSAPSLSSSVSKMPSATHASFTPRKTPGSTWIYSYGEKPWPVVLCDERTAPKKFMESRRKDSHLPTILLGKRI